MAKKIEKPRAPQLEIVEITPEEAAPKARKTRAKAQEPSAQKLAAPKLSAKEPSAAAAKPKPAAKPRKAKVKIKSESGEELEIHVPVGAPFKHPGNDPIGDVTDGEGQSVASIEAESAETESSGTEDAQLQPEMAAHRADTREAALDGTLGGTLEDQPLQTEPPDDEADDEAEPAHEAVRRDEPAHLNRLQKILSQAGIASRRRAEELITEGRVQVNGQVVTQLGAKADASRDHIRVDGKLISGAERHRYYMLNKPKGYVTTVSDPEGRPTVMHFFEKMRERLYPVGRLDYLSEGLLLVTNDGELANQLTRAASGVEKTYLVKVAGQPTEEQIEQLRAGIAIDREGPGSGRVHTSPARISQARRGDNPWFEVVLIEGRNRELRKMFSAIGHFVEKIRRVGYGPLVLDLEPGKFRELEPEELVALRLAAEGKWKPRRPKTTPKTTKILPKEAGHAPEPRAFKPRPGGPRPFRDQAAGREQPRWKREGGTREPSTRGGAREPQRTFRPQGEGSGGRSSYGHPQGEQTSPRARSFGERPQGRPFRERPDREPRNFDAPRETRRDDRGPSFRPQQRDRDSRPEGAPNRTWQKAPPAQRGGAGRQGDRPYAARPTFNRSESTKPRFDRPAGKSFSKPRSGEFAPRPPARFDKPEGRSFSKPRTGDFPARPARSFDKPASGGFSKPRGGEFAARPAARFDKPAGRSFSKPRTGDFPARPARSFDKPAGRGFSKGPAQGRDETRAQRPARPFRSDSGPRSGEQSRPAPTGRAKPAFGAKPGFKPAFKSGSKPGFKSGSKSGFKRSGPPRSGGSRPGSRKRG